MNAAAADREPGRETQPVIVPEPLLAPPSGRRMASCSGAAMRCATAATGARLCTDGGLHFPGRVAALLLRAETRSARASGGRMTMDPGLDAGDRDAPRRCGSRERADAPPRMARHQRAGRLLLGTVAGVVTRRYHGLLVAALPAPLGRMVMLNHLLERVRLPTRGVMWLGDEDEVAGPNAIDRADHLSSSGSSSGCRSGDTRSTATRSRSAC